MARGIEEARQEIVLGITASLGRLVAARKFLTPPQCIEVAETLRDAADEIDHGEGDRLRTRRLVLISACGPLGRPLYRLL
jgi:hypothetical protein